MQLPALSNCLSSLVTPPYFLSVLQLNALTTCSSFIVNYNSNSCPAVPALSSCLSSTLTAIVIKKLEVHGKFFSIPT